MKKVLFLLLVVLCTADFMVIARAKNQASIFPSYLRVENRLNPSVIEADRAPRMSWVNEPVDSTIRGVSQSAYRILVASSKDKLDMNAGDIWDSGMVKSEASYLIDYAGNTLEAGKDYWWKVQVWDNKGRRSDWSSDATFGTGLSDGEWKAKWIGAPWQGEAASNEYRQAPVFSRTFNVDTAGLVSAKIFVTGLGYYELALNGVKVGDDFFVPNVTNYGPRPNLDKCRLPMEDNYTDSRVLYLAYNIKNELHNGDNTIQAIVGNGFFSSNDVWIEWYGSPRFLCQIHLDYANGKRHVIVSDENWTASPSCVVFNNVYKGEVYDANVDENPNPVVIRNAPEGKLTAHTAPTDKILRIITPKTFVKNRDGSFSINFGEEVSGWVRLSGMNGCKGDTVLVRYKYDYGLPLHSTRTADYSYIMDGSGNETCIPKFTWYTFSSVTVYGLKEMCSDNVVGEIVGTSVTIDSEFSSSDSILNKIVEIWQRTQTDNMHCGLPSDCPHRERNAYTGDGQVASAMVMANYDAAAFYEKWMRDIRDAQHDNGYVPNSAPWQPGCGGGVPWGAAINIIPWEYYLNYGDKRALSDNYDGMKKHTDSMTVWLTLDNTMFQQMNILGQGKPFYWFNLGEWGLRDNLPDVEFVHTFYLWMCADITAKAADILGYNSDAIKYHKLAKQTKDAFYLKFYNADKKSFGKSGSNVFALAMGVPDNVRDHVVNSLRKEIEEDNDCHLNTGIFGTRYIFEVLAENGLAELAYKIMTQRTYPGFGYWVENGATTMWEFWNGYGSHNHPMFGGGLVWLYRDLAGINYDPEIPGYRHVIIRPVVVDGLEKITYSKNTPYGKVLSTVTNQSDTKSIDLIIPVGATATVYLPGQAQPKRIVQGLYHFDF